MRTVNSHGLSASVCVWTEFLDMALIARERGNHSGSGSGYSGEARRDVSPPQGNPPPPQGGRTELLSTARQTFCPQPPPPSVKMRSLTSGTRAGDIGCDPSYFKGAERSRGTHLPSPDDNTLLWGPDWVQTDIFSIDQGQMQTLMPN